MNEQTNAISASLLCAKVLTSHIFQYKSLISSHLFHPNVSTKCQNVGKFMPCACQTDEIR